ncbi:MAG: hypothetical protein ABIK28_25675 [Planctomycetota bacterium]
MNTIKQALGSPDCIGCVAAMATGTTFEEFLRFSKGRPSPWTDLDCFVYLLIHGFIMGGIGGQIEPEDDVPNTVVYGFRLDGQPAIASVTKGTGRHFLFWDGQEIHDPAPGVVEKRHWSDYQVESVWPVTQIPEEYFKAVKPLFHVTQPQPAPKAKKGRSRRFSKFGGR